MYMYIHYCQYFTGHTIGLLAHLVIGLHDSGPVDGGRDEGHHVDEETEDELLKGGQQSGPQREILMFRRLVCQVGHL